MSGFRALSALVALSVSLSACLAPVPREGGRSAPPDAPRTAPPTTPAAPAGLSDADLSQRARAFVATVAAVEPIAERECRNRAPHLDCDFRIVVDDRPGMPSNAFQTRDRDGRPIIAFTLALIAEAENSDELAFILAHEAAHHIRGHLDRQNRNATIGAVVLGQLASSLGGGSAEQVQTAQELGAAFGARTYSRDFELEADELGTIITLMAGFDPLRGAEFFGRIPDPGNRFLGTHPPNAQRIATVRRTVAAMGG